MPIRTSSRAGEEDSHNERRHSQALFRLHDACRRNASALIDEAELLFKHRRHERAFFLAVGSYEEIGKSQVVADYITGVTSSDEFEAAFRSHRFKIAFNERYIQVPPGELRYDLEGGGTLVGQRNAALYVDRAETDEPLLPSDAITEEHARKMIDRVHEEFDSIVYAEWMNGRIGSEGLLK